MCNIADKHQRKWEQYSVESRNFYIWINHAVNHWILRLNFAYVKIIFYTQIWSEFHLQMSSIQLSFLLFYNPMICWELTAEDRAFIWKLGKKPGMYDKHSLNISQPKHLRKFKVKAKTQRIQNIKTKLAHNIFSKDSNCNLILFQIVCHYTLIRNQFSKDIIYFYPVNLNVTCS